MILELKNIKAFYPDGYQALDDINVSVEKKSFVVVLGESGSGKTTLFKVITGVLDPSEGSVFINDKDVTNLMTMSRDLTMIFQNFVLYPHMTVYQNVLTGLNGFDMSDDDKDQKVKEILSEFGLINYLNFKPRHLSDGQKQRVAMCKSLIREPSLFLMDEPLSNLDLPQRTRIKKELIDIYQRYDTSLIYITHDLKDAEMLSTVIWIMDYGRIVQTGTIKEIRNNPRSLRVFHLVTAGEINEFKVHYQNHKLSCFGLEIDYECDKDDGDYTCAIQYKDIYLDTNSKLKGEIYSSKITPNGVLLTLTVEDNQISLLTDDDDEIDYEVGQVLSFSFKKEGIKLFKIKNN